MKFRKLLSQLPENGVFWLLLFSLAIGSATSLYGKITDRSEAEAAAYERYTAVSDSYAASVSGSLSVISMKDYVSSALPYPCQIYHAPAALR